MALHSVDKNGTDRSNPAPNVHDTILVTGGRMAHKTNSLNYLSPGQSPQTQSALFNAQKTLVLTDVTAVPTNGSTLSTTTVAHNLGYAPLVEASLNNATITGITGKVNLPLPTYLSASIGGVTSGVVTFSIYLYVLVDATNVYFQILNAAGTTLSVNVTYYLYQQRVVN